MSDYILTSDGELMHYGVPGMKWGHRKARPQSDLDRARSNYRVAKGQYNKAFKKANRYSSVHPISQFVGKKAKAESDKRWGDAIDKAKAVDSAKKAYKEAKVDHKNAKKAMRNKQTQKVSSKKQAGRKKAKKILQTGVKASAKTVSIGAQMAARMMQNNVVYGTSGAIFDRIYDR